MNIKYSFTITKKNVKEFSKDSTLTSIVYTHQLPCLLVDMEQIYVLVLILTFNFLVRMTRLVLSMR